MGDGISARLGSLPRARVLEWEVPVAVGFRARLLGLSYMNRLEAGCGLLIPACSCVHTFGMRFALDLVFLDEGGAPIVIRRGVPPRRLAVCRAATAVLELPNSGSGADLEGENLPPLRT